MPALQLEQLPVWTGMKVPPPMLGPRVQRGIPIGTAWQGLGACKKLRRSGVLARLPPIATDITREQTFVPTLCVDAWRQELAGDPDEHFLLDGVENGFRIVDSGSVVAPASTDNYKSVTSQAEFSGEGDC